jgi:hypothetical protein
MPQSLITPIKDEITEVKEEEYEESPGPMRQLHHSERQEFDSSMGKEIEEQIHESEDRSPDGQSGSEEQEEQEDEGEGEGDDQSEQIPLLFVDVNLGEGTTGKLQFNTKTFVKSYFHQGSTTSLTCSSIDRIVLYDGDDPADVAKEFSSRHNLDSSMTDKLTDLLTQQMNGVLSKIIEEDDDAENIS